MLRSALLLALLAQGGAASAEIRQGETTLHVGSYGQPVVTSNISASDLVQYCDMKALDCKIYLKGVTDALFIEEEICDTFNSSKDRIDVLADSIRSYLKENTKLLHKSAYVLIRETLKSVDNDKELGKFFKRCR